MSCLVTMLPLSHSFHRRTFFLYRKLRPTSRIIHTAHIDPIIQEFTPKLLTKQPAFAFLPQNHVWEIPVTVTVLLSTIVKE